jgi:hypothetical protein
LRLYKNKNAPRITGPTKTKTHHEFPHQQKQKHTTDFRTNKKEKL